MTGIWWSYEYSIWLWVWWK